MPAVEQAYKLRPAGISRFSGRSRQPREPVLNLWARGLSVFLTNTSLRTSGARPGARRKPSAWSVFRDTHHVLTGFAAVLSNRRPKSAAMARLLQHL